MQKLKQMNHALFTAGFSVVQKATPTSAAIWIWMRKVGQERIYFYATPPLSQIRCCIIDETNIESPTLCKNDEKLQKLVLRHCANTRAFLDEVVGELGACHTMVVRTQANQAFYNPLVEETVPQETAKRLNHRGLDYVLHAFQQPTFPMPQSEPERADGGFTLDVRELQRQRSYR